MKRTRTLKGKQLIRRGQGKEKEHFRENIRLLGKSNRPLEEEMEVASSNTLSITSVMSQTSPCVPRERIYGKCVILSSFERHIRDFRNSLSALNVYAI